MIRSKISCVLIDRLALLVLCVQDDKAAKLEAHTDIIGGIDLCATSRTRDNWEEIVERAADLDGVTIKLEDYGDTCHMRVSASLGEDEVCSMLEAYFHMYTDYTRDTCGDELSCDE